MCYQQRQGSVCGVFLIVVTDLPLHIMNQRPQNGQIEILTDFNF